MGFIKKIKSNKIILFVILIILQGCKQSKSNQQIVQDAPFAAKLVLIHSLVDQYDYVGVYMKVYELPANINMNELKFLYGLGYEKLPLKNFIILPEKLREFLKEGDEGFFSMTNLNKMNLGYITLY